MQFDGQHYRLRMLKEFNLSRISVIRQYDESRLSQADREQKNDVN